MRSTYLACAIIAAAFYACAAPTSSSPATDNAASTGGVSGGDTTGAGGFQNGGEGGASDDDDGTDPLGGGGDNGDGTDGGSSHGGGEGGAGKGADAGADSGTACIKAATKIPDGHHHPGQDCLSCHDGNSDAPKYTIAGTLYSAATGGTEVSSGTIEVTDAKGKVIDLATALDGNFFTSTTVTYPLTMRASKCPSDMHMTSPVAKTDGASCNQSGCHDSAMRLHLP